MTNLVELGPLSSFLSNERHLLTLRSLSSTQATERQIVVFRLAPRSASDESYHWYAIESECPHAGAPMKDAELVFGDGDIEDMEDMFDEVVAVCPTHAYDFNLRTGESSTGYRACTWRVHVENGTVLMDWPEESGDWEVIDCQPVSEGPCKRISLSPGSIVSAAYAQSPPTAFAEPVTPTGLQAPSLPETLPTKLTDWAVLILNTADPEQKVALTREAARRLRAGEFPYPEGILGTQTPPDKPPRLAARPEAKPAKMGKGPNSSKSQLVYLHNVAHIEQWAIDLAWDLLARFARPFADSPDELMPQHFFVDWVTIAEEEAKHYSLLRTRLEAKGSSYGAFRTQDGLWDSADATKDSIASRLSIVCLVHEARGLDVNPAQILKFRSIGDEETAQAMTVVHADEVTHVAAGHRYLTYYCEKQGLDPVKVFRENVRKHFLGKLRGPFNHGDRLKAGLKEEWYAGDWDANERVD